MAVATSEVAKDFVDVDEAAVDLEEAATSPNRPMSVNMGHSRSLLSCVIPKAHL